MSKTMEKLGRASTGRVVIAVLRAEKVVAAAVVHYSFVFLEEKNGKRRRNLSVVVNKTPVVSHENDKATKACKQRGGWPIVNGSQLFGVGDNTIGRDNVTQIVDLRSSRSLSTVGMGNQSRMVMALSARVDGSWLKFGEWVIVVVNNQKELGYEWGGVVMVKGCCLGLAEEGCLGFAGKGCLGLAEGGYLADRWCQLGSDTLSASLVFDEFNKTDRLGDCLWSLDV
ncbi:hypothetical protein L6452_19555 [Arctium lappa]|uniref:Uncharacterized protein n=1 Tax=Arctium lappa TaxID=4217 RepID=A0ACB9BAA3_ARCLA|nr:hypothetical protein L6452_19555 [Arctium lappa]